MRPYERLIILILFAVVASYVLAACVYKPYHNWDMIGYIAAAKAYEEGNARSLHAFTFDALRNSVSESTYQELVQGAYRHVVHEDPSAFGEQLVFYKVRPLYTGLIYVLYKMGVDIAVATYIISGVAVVIALTFLYLMSVSVLEKRLIYAVPFLALVFGITDLARLSTPDGLAFLAIMISAYLFLKQRLSLLLIFLPFTLAIRTDLILFTVPLLLVVFILRRNSRWQATLSMVVSIAVYIAILSYWEYPGWSTIVYVSMIEPLPHPISMPPTLTLQQYIYTMFKNLVGLLIFTPEDGMLFVLYVLFTAYALYLVTRLKRLKPGIQAFDSSSFLLSIVCVVFVFTHFVAFPVAWQRFFAAPYVICAFAFLVVVTEIVKTADSAQQGAEPNGNTAALHRHR